MSAGLDRYSSSRSSYSSGYNSGYDPSYDSVCSCSECHPVRSYSSEIDTSVVEERVSLGHLPSFQGQKELDFIDKEKKITLDDLKDIKALYESFDALSLDDSENSLELELVRAKWKEVLQTVPHDRHGITPQHAAKLAKVVHEHFNYAGDTHYIRPGVRSPRHVLVDTTNSHAIVFSKEKGRTIKGGVNKKPSDVIKFKFEEKLPTIAEHKICFATHDHTYSDRKIKLETLFGLPFELITYMGKDGKMKTKMLQEAWDGSLADFIDILKPHELFKVFCDITTHLKFMHEKGFVHRDIKIENVIIKRNPDGTVSARLIDFEYSYNLTDEFPKIKLTEPAGYGYVTPAYIAPEHFKKNCLLKDKLEQGKADDMYAIGIILLQCLYGRRIIGEDGYVWDVLKDNMPEPGSTDLDLDLDDLARDLFNNRPGKRISVQELSLRLSSLEPLIKDAI